MNTNPRTEDRDADGAVGMPERIWAFPSDEDGPPFWSRRTTPNGVEYVRADRASALSGAEQRKWPSPDLDWSDYVDDDGKRTGPPIDLETLLMIGTVRSSGGPDSLYPIKRMALVRMVDEIVDLRPQVSALTVELEAMRKLLGGAARVMDLGRRWIESNQVADKDLHGTLVRARDDIREALTIPSGEG